MNMIEQKLKYIYIFLVERNEGNYEEVKRITSKKAKEIISFSGKTYKVNIEHPNYVKLNYRFYFINIYKNTEIRIVKRSIFDIFKKRQEQSIMENIDESDVQLDDSEMKMIESQFVISPNDYDNFAHSHALKQIVGTVSTNKKEQYVKLFIGFGIGLLLGLLVMDFVKAKKINELYQQLVDQSPIVIEMLKGLRWLS